MAKRRSIGELMRPPIDDIGWAQRRAIDALRFHGMDSVEYRRARDAVNRLLEPAKELDLKGVAA